MPQAPEDNPAPPPGPSAGSAPNPAPSPDSKRTPEPDEHPRDHREEARRIWAVTRIGLLGLYRSQLPRMAAALAYRTIFSIIPVMAIGLLIFGSVVSDRQVESGVRRVLDFAGISQISTADPASPDSAIQTGEMTPDQVMDSIEQAAQDQEQAQGQSQSQSQAKGQGALNDPFDGADLEEVITNLVKRVNRSIKNVPTGWIALTSGLVLLYAAMSMLIEIEKSFNQLCNAPSGRSWLRRLILYWTILTAGSLLLGATFFVGDALTRSVVSIFGRDSMVGAVMAGYGASVLISSLLLLGAYTTIPNTKIHFRTAVAGAFFAAVIWELGKLGFTTYLRYTTNYAKFYGSIAILPLFMLWIYLTWLIVLFGMQATYTLQNFSRIVDSKLRNRSGDLSRDTTLIDPLVVLVVAKLVHKSFQDGLPIGTDRIAKLTALTESQASDLLEALTDAGVVSKVYKGDSFSGYSPSRPADRIALGEILGAAYKVDAFRRADTHDQLPDSIAHATLASCEGKTLADLISTPTGRPPGDAPPAQTV